MTPETLEALKGSIEKWRKIEAEEAFNRGARDCPLCALFVEHFCEGCPIFDFVGRRYCRDTPYFQYVEAAGFHGTGSLQAKEAARAELDFLRSLLPKEEEAE